MNKIFLLLIAFPLLFTSCIQNLDDWLKTNEIDFKRTVETKYFAIDYAGFEINNFQNELTIDFNLYLPAKFPFPIDKRSSDTLRTTSFKFTFYENGKVIPINVKPVKSYYYEWDIDSTRLILNLKPENISYGYHKLVKVPLSLFHNLKNGKHDLMVEIKQEKFMLAANTTPSDTGVPPPSADTCMIKGKLNFKLTIPEIYLTNIYGNSIELQYDSIWSPAGMDFTMFTAGYPDIYWELFFPVSHNRDFSHPCFVSTVVRTAVRRLEKDTVRLYHYSENDKIFIGVYDQDIITRDDFIGDWYGSLKMLAAPNGAYKRLKFDHVEWFEVRAEPKGIINN
ncbi:MAG: hypothetical protein HY958_05065 [Bacteroidia bacterium]|nr:hypothetical protein [Bacteroidia bacterium]